MTRTALLVGLLIVAAAPAHAQGGGGPLAHLPLTTYVPTGTPRGGFVFLSGDGGWRSFDQANADSLRAEGYVVLGVDALSAFYHEVSGDSLAALTRFLVSYVRGKVPTGAPVYLGGYSFGAELSADALPRGIGADGLFLLGPGRRGIRTITLGGFLFAEPRGPTSFDVAERLNAERCTPVVFVTGTDDQAGEGTQVFPLVRQPAAQFLVAGAGHHYHGGDQRYTRVMREALAWLAAHRASCGR
jgi:type IV secretory pathway VirJ component